MNKMDKQKITDDVLKCFIERNINTIAEKISDCIRRGFTKDDAHHTVIQAVKNLPNHLLPLEDAVSDYKLTLANDGLARHVVGLATHFPDDDFE